MLEVALGVLLLTALVGGLAATVLAARRLLLPRHEVTVTVNDRAPLRTRAGVKLLGVLTDAGLEIPSACGGVGTCGLCRVTVVEGGDPPHPIERGASPRASSPRASVSPASRPCGRDLRVRVADEVLGARRRRCTVVSARTVAVLVKEVVLALPPGETLSFRAGAFVQVTRPPGHPALSRRRRRAGAPWGLGRARPVAVRVGRWGADRSRLLAGEPARGRDPGRVARPPRAASVGRTRGDAAGPRVVVPVRAGTGRRGGGGRPVRRVLRARDDARTRDGAARRRGRSGAVAVHRARPARAATDDAADHVLVRRALAARRLPRGGVRAARRRPSELPLAGRALGTRGGRRVDRVPRGSSTARRSSST